MNSSGVGCPVVAPLSWVGRVLPRAAWRPAWCGLSWYVVAGTCIAVHCQCIRCQVREDCERWHGWRARRVWHGSRPPARAWAVEHACPRRWLSPPGARLRYIVRGSLGSVPWGALWGSLGSLGGPWGPRGHYIGRIIMISIPPETTSQYLLFGMFKT